MKIEDYIVHLLSAAKKTKEITNDSLCTLVNNKYSDLETKMSPVIIRKIINGLRQSGIPVLANSRGYFISNDKEEMLEMYISLMNRANAIIKAAQGIKNKI